MGICGSIINSEKNIDKENPIDKIIYICNNFMKNKIPQEKLKNFLPSLLYYQTLQEKSDFVKINRFNKWLEMSSLIRAFKIYNDNNLIKNDLIIKKKIVKEDIFFGKDIKLISHTEIGLRNFYNKNKLKFESRLIKTPPSVFRWVSWLIVTNLSLTRDYISYEKIIEKKISKKKNLEILYIIEGTIKEKCLNSNLIKSCLFRILKSIIIIDPEIIFLKQLSYIISFLIMTSNFDEINIFYMIINLLSSKNNPKFFLRNFYTENRPLIIICIKIFEKKFEIFFPELYSQFNDNKINIKNLIENWFLLCYVNIFPYDIILKIWDSFLIYGVGFLISLGLSLLEFFYEDLLNMNSEKEIKKFFIKLNKINKKNFEINLEIINIENIISNAIKKYEINNEIIFNELKNLVPNINMEYEYDLNKEYNNINESIDNNSNNSISTIDRNGSFSECSVNNKCYLRLNSLIENNDFSNFEENINENIELSISQHNIFCESLRGGDNGVNYNEISCEEIEDENNYIQEHIEDLMSKQQEYFNLNSNYIK